MTSRHSSRPVVILVVAMAAAAAGCADDGAPRRVPDDGAPCSAMMPRAPERGDSTFRLGAVTVTERAWVLRMPEGGAEPAAHQTTFVLRRAAVPAGSALRDAAVLDAAAARVVRGIELGVGDGTKPTTSKVATDAGEAVDLRWATGTVHNATRLLPIPGGYCEATILGARTEADVTAYFASVRVRP